MPDAARAPELDLDASATTAASLELNGVPCIRVAVVRAGGARLHGCTLRITIDGLAGAAYERGVESVAAGQSLRLTFADGDVRATADGAPPRRKPATPSQGTLL